MYIPDILRNKYVQLGVVSIVSAAGGYFVGKKKARIHVHITRNKSIFDEDHPPVEVVTTETVTTTVEVVVDDELVDFKPINVFTKEDSDWDMEAELATRGDGKRPYIVHQEEFINDEFGFHQSTVTYYAGDDIMGDTDDTVIYNYQTLMGPLRFGHGSKDASVVYIRNEAIQQEWEVLLHTGYYAQEVRGLEMEKAAEEELKHSVQKFRQE